MANLAIIDNFNSCNNIFYYALASEYAPNPPPNILPSHTGIADSGATDFYFAPNAPVTNYNPQAPTVGVRLANGRPERSVASATLASVPSLPQAAMPGHVMPSFPHILIDLGPFADLGCKIVFTKTSVTVYHPDGHPIHSGWRGETGPCLWHFPLTTEAAQVALDDASPQPPILSTPQCAPADVVITPRKQKRVSVSARKLKRSCHAAVKQHRHTSPRRRVTFILPAHHVDKDSTIWRRVHPKERTTYPIDQLEAHLPAPPLPGQPHPSQEIPVISATGAACSVYYIYGAAQAVALAARAAGTAFDPRSLDLPSIGALVGFYHACLGFPVKQTWLHAIKNGNCDTFDGLTYSIAAKYCLDSDETIMGNLAQQCQNGRLTKPKQPTSLPLVCLPPPVATPSNQVFVMTQPLSKLFTDDTGRFPARLAIPVFRNLFFGPEKPFLTGFLRISFFPAFSGGIFHRNVVLEGVAEIPVFFRFYRIFLQEFLWDRNSCILPGILQIPEDSGGFLFPPKAAGSGQRLKKALC
jgi:hypothetical protein